MWASVATGCLSTLGALCARQEKEEEENDRECVGGGGARFWGSEGGGLLSFGPSGSQRAHLVQMPRIELSKPEGKKKVPGPEPRWSSGSRSQITAAR